MIELHVGPTAEQQYLFITIVNNNVICFIFNALHFVNSLVSFDLMTLIDFQASFVFLQYISQRDSIYPHIPYSRLYD